MKDLHNQTTVSAELRTRLRQQAAVAELGQLALEGLHLEELLEAAVVVLKNILQVDYTKILEILPGGESMVLRAGVGWHKKVVIGQTTLGAGGNSQAGYTLQTYRPVIVYDLQEEARFDGPSLLRDHQVRSGMSVIIRGKNGPYGVLGIHSKKVRQFTPDDANFLQAVANILAASIQRREAESQLVSHQEWLLLAQKAAEIGTFEWAIEKNKIIWTKEMEELYGVPHETFDGTFETWMSLIHSDDARAVQGLIERALSSQSAEVFAEFRTRPKDGASNWLSLRSRIFYSHNEPQRMVGVTLDITRRKEAEIHKDEFIGIVSHELKTPVTSLKAYGQVLQRRFRQQNNTEAVQQLAKMDFQLDKLTSLIGDLLDVTKIESGRLELRLQEFSVPELVDEIIGELQPTTIQHTISRSGTSEKPLVADRDRSGQVLINFISNAIKYSPNAKKIIVHIREGNDAVQIGVQDFGMGLEPEDANRVFERFFRVERPHKNSFPGIGLGLFISAEIIQRQGGRIWVESVPKKGSTFWFELPRKVKKKEQG